MSIVSSPAGLKLALSEKEFRKCWYIAWFYVCAATLVPGWAFSVLVWKIISNDEIDPLFVIFSPLALSISALMARSVLNESVKEFKVSKSLICVIAGNGKIKTFEWKDLTRVNAHGNVLHFSGKRYIRLRYTIGCPVGSSDLQQLWFYLLDDLSLFQRLLGKARATQATLSLLLTGVLLSVGACIHFYENPRFSFYLSLCMLVLLSCFSMISFRVNRLAQKEIAEFVKSMRRVESGVKN